MPTDIGACSRQTNSANLKRFAEHVRQLGRLHDRRYPADVRHGCQRASASALEESRAACGTLVALVAVLSLAAASARLVCSRPILRRRRAFGDAAASRRAVEPDDVDGDAQQPGHRARRHAARDRRRRRVVALVVSLTDIRARNAFVFCFVLPLMLAPQVDGAGLAADCSGRRARC